MIEAALWIVSFIIVIIFSVLSLTALGLGGLIIFTNERAKKIATIILLIVGFSISYLINTK